MYVFKHTIITVVVSYTIRSIEARHKAEEIEDLKLSYAAYVWITYRVPNEMFSDIGVISGGRTAGFALLHCGALTGFLAGGRLCAFSFCRTGCYTPIQFVISPEYQ